MHDVVAIGGRQARAVTGQADLLALPDVATTGAHAAHRAPIRGSFAPWMGVAAAGPEHVRSFA